MNARSFWILSFAVAAGVVTTMSGCGGSGASRTVPLVDERALDSAMTLRLFVHPHDRSAAAQ